MNCPVRTNASSRKNVTAAPISASVQAVQAGYDVQYVNELWYLAVAILALLTAGHVIGLTLDFFRRSPSKRARQRGDKALPAMPGWNTRPSMRRLPQAALTALRIYTCRWSIPIGRQAVMLVSEAIIIFGFIIALIAWELSHTQHFNAMYWNRRAATLAGAQIPIIIALSGKNNMISWLTGISYEKLNMVHRASGRLLFVMAWIHTIGRILQGLHGPVSFQMNWVRAGAVSLGALNLLVILSIRPIRTRVYEFFHFTHVFLVILTIAAAWYHKPDYGFYFWPGLLLWAMDRVFRAARMWFYNRRAKTKEYAEAMIEWLSSSTVRVTVRRSITWQPGQHAYLTIPTISRFPNEAHPFSIASIPDSDASKEHDMVFLIRGRKGFTRRLQHHATRQPISYVKAYVDGPYGTPPDLRSYSTVVLIAGGSGISFCMPLLLGIVRDAKRDASMVKRVLLVWTIRQPEQVKWIMSSLMSALGDAPANLNIEPRIFVTGSSPMPIAQLAYEFAAERNGEMKAKFDKYMAKPNMNFMQLKIELGRPHLDRLLQGEIETAHGAVSVNVAGPAPLAKDVRRALRDGPASPKAVMRGAPLVALHVETFGY